MTWFLTLQSPTNATNQQTTYELQDAVDVDVIAQQLVASAASDNVVPIPVMVHTSRNQKVTVYVRPSAWGAWMFYQLSEEDRRKMAERLTAFTRAAQQRVQVAQTPPSQGPGGPGSIPAGI